MSAAPARHPRPIQPRPNQPRPNQPRSAQPQRRTEPQRRSEPQRGSQPQRRSEPQRGSKPQRRAQQTGPGARGHLRAVAAPEQARSLVPFAWMCTLIIVGALTAVLFINTSMARGAYERRDLKVETATLHEQRASLVTQLEQKSSPNTLGEDARNLGMLPATDFGFITLADTLVIESRGK